VTRVLFVAYHFPPLGGGGVQRAVKFARYLPEFGYEPVVITGPGGATDRWTPEDATLADQVTGIEVHRAQPPEPPLSTGWRRRAERVLDLRTPFDRWWTEQIVKVGRSAAGGASIILGELVPYISGEGTCRLARELRLPWVADLQDPWALDEMWLYPTAIHRLHDRSRMQHVLQSAQAIVMNTPEAALRVRRQFSELAPKVVEAIPNGLDSSDVPTVPGRRSDVFRVVHAGYLHTLHGLEHRRTRPLRELLGGAPVRGVDIYTRSHVFLLEAIDKLIAEDPSIASTVEVHLAGVLTDLDREVAARSPVARLHGYLTHPETVELLCSADLLFLPMHDLPEGTRAGIVPGKTYEYLAIGRPILAAVPDGDARDLLVEAGNSYLCRPGDSTAMAAIIKRQVERWRRGAPVRPPAQEIVERYERRRQTEQLAEVLDRVRGVRAEARPEAARAVAGD
jgi:glycosyltransferase involved in cell wall biosynthesis